MSSPSTDWSSEKYREMLIYQRRFMWNEDTLDKLAVWLGLKPGMTAVDIGCGLGYLGYTWWPYFGDNGKYIGVDLSSELLHDAKKASREWAVGGDTEFINGDAYNVPIADNSVDWAMCQVVLMHLTHPQNALKEMVRAVRPGGLVVCIEPDNLSSALIKRNWSLPEPDIEELLLVFKIELIANKGRIKLGRGDTNIGVKLVHMMSKAGLVDIDSRLNDGVWFVEPPYEGELQQHRLKYAKRNMLDAKHQKFWDDKIREEFLAGGGNPEDFDRYLEIEERLRFLSKDQFEKGEFYGFGSGDYYITKGRKPR
jgi:SAM-dependent methyltransferase